MLKKLIRSFRKPREKNNSPAHVVGVKEHRLSLNLFSRNAVQITHQLQQAGYQAFLVGGCVRDALLGERPKDFDVSTSATPEQIRAVFPRARIIGRRFKLVHVRFGRELIEVATFRGSHVDDGQHDDQSAHDSSGRILRDNVYGTLEEDAQRRDFTINALYYDPINQNIYDFANGLADMRQGTLRLIGDPRQRYLEDPVRMLRAARFAAKLEFDMAAETEAPIRELAPLLADIPAARLFDESLKLFLSGSAEDACLLLQDYGLFTPLFPLTAQAIEIEPEYSQAIIQNALRNTDERLRDGKHVTPAFLFAALLWPAVRQQNAQLQAEGMPAIPALQQAAQHVLHDQLQHISIPKRFSLVTREIWAMQERLPRRHGNRADNLVNNIRFRAAYDFLLLRESAGEQTDGLGQWWTDYQFADDSKRRDMIRKLSGGSARKSRRPRKRKPAGSTPSGQP